GLPGFVPGLHPIVDRKNALAGRRLLENASATTGGEKSIRRSRDRWSAAYTSFDEISSQCRPNYPCCLLVKAGKILLIKLRFKINERILSLLEQTCKQRARIRRWPGQVITSR